MATNLDFKVKNGLITGGNALIGKSAATFGYRLEISSGTKTLGLHADNGTTFIYGDGDFAMGTLSANPINFYTNTAQRATLLANGNFGVGTAAPAALVHAYSGITTSTPAAIFYSNTGGSAVGSYPGFSIWSNLSAGQVESTLVFGNTVNSFLAFGHHNGTTYAERMRIDALGNVVIGTTSTPSGTGNATIEGKLIVASAAATPAIFLPYPANTYAGFKIEHSATNISGASNSTSFQMRPAYTSGVGTGADVDVIRFSNTSPHTYPDVLLAPDGGLVGINTGSVTPVAKLDVRDPNSWTAPIATPAARFAVNNGGATVAANQGLTIYNNLSNGNTDTTLVYGATTLSYLAFGHHNGTTYAERMRIDAAGKVGINRSTFTTQLEVGGSIATVMAASSDTSIAANINGVSNLAIGCNDTASTNATGAPAGTNYLGCSIGRPTVFTTAATERMRLTATGGLSFGSTGTAVGTAGQVLTSAGNAPPTWTTIGAGTGTVTSASVVSANGFAGTVATATSTPAITLTTSITGILKGNGSAMSAAVAADFPTLNQSTTGNAATATTTNALSATCLATSNIWTGSTQQFTSITGATVGIANQAGSLQAYGNTTTLGAFMSFHRPTQYAVNMGLDADNTFRIGGWSDGLNTYRLQSSAAQLTAPKVVSSFNGVTTTVASAGDLVTRRSATTGALYFGDSISSYLYFDGTSYQFGSAGGVSASSMTATSMSATTFTGALSGNATTATSATGSQLLKFSDGTAFMGGATAIPTSGSRSADLAPNTYQQCAALEFKNSSLYSNTGTYTGLLTIAPWLGTTVSTGDSSYQLSFNPAAANSTAAPVFKIRAGIDTTWGAWSTIIHSSNTNLITSTGTITSGTWSGSFGAVSGANLTNLDVTHLTGTTLPASIVTSSLTAVGTITTGTWSGSFGAVSGANLTNLTAGNLTGTISSTVLGNSTMFIGTTGVALNRASATLNLAGIGTFAASGAVTMTAGTASSTTTTGTLVVTGGIGVSGQVTAGTLYSNGDVTAFSDARIKTDIEVIPNALNKVCQIRGVTYTRTDNGDLERGKRSTGVIAQEVEAVLPEAVVRDALDPENGTMGVNYGNLAGLLIEAIKELRQENLELKARLAMLEAKEI